MVKIAINGFGRIGRLVFRELINRKFKIVAVNDVNKSARLCAYLVKYDSSHGQFKGSICSSEKTFTVNGKEIRLTNERDPLKVGWGKYKIDYLIESSGVFTDRAKAEQHITGGAKKVIITAPSPDAPMYVCGVNTDKYCADQKIVSNASCTTNCLAPLTKVVFDNFGLVEGLMTTIHAVTLNQPILDGGKEKDYRLGRSALVNIIPSSTGAAKAVGKVIPEVDGKLTGMSFRVPVPTGSVVDLTARLCKDSCMDEINSKLKCACQNEMKGIMKYVDEPIVSHDIIGSPYSSIYDATAGIMLGNRFVKLISWYDNEYGYSVRVVDLLEYMIAKDACAGASAAPKASGSCKHDTGKKAGPSKPGPSKPPAKAPPKPPAKGPPPKKK